MSEKREPSPSGTWRSTLTDSSQKQVHGRNCNNLYRGETVGAPTASQSDLIPEVGSMRSAETASEIGEEHSHQKKWSSSGRSEGPWGWRRVWAVRLKKPGGPLQAVKATLMSFDLFIPAAQTVEKPYSGAGGAAWCHRRMFSLRFRNARSGCSMGTALERAGGFL